MKVVPLLAIQRGLYNVPIESRFDAYLETMLLPNRQDIRLPLQNMNPMAKNHVPKLLDHYLALDAEGMAKQIMEETLTAGASSGPRKGGNCYDHLLNNDEICLGLVLADDALGGWTDKLDVQFKNDFRNQGLMWNKGWLEVLLWSSDGTETSQASLQTAVELVIHRAAYSTKQQQKPNANARSVEEEPLSITTLGHMLDQEAWVWKQYNRIHQLDGNPSIVDDDLYLSSYLALLTKHKDLLIDSEFPTIAAAFYGDQAAAARGYTPIIGTDEWNGTVICKRGLWDVLS